MPIIAEIFMNAIQNSISPYALTVTRFITVIIIRQTSTPIHFGKSGNQ